MKLSHARGATHNGRVMVERFDRMWPTGEGNGKPLQYSCLENPMNRSTPGLPVLSNLDSILKSRDITLPTKVHTVKAMFFSSNHIWMWELNHKEDWAVKNWCFWISVLEKTLESPLNCKEIKPVSPKGNQSWIFMKGLMLNWSSNILTTWCKEQTH